MCEEGKGRREKKHENRKAPLKLKNNRRIQGDQGGMRSGSLEEIVGISKESCKKE